LAPATRIARARRSPAPALAGIALEARRVLRVDPMPARRFD
jgi:hypothetical protein